MGSCFHYLPHRLAVLIGLAVLWVHPVFHNPLDINQLPFINSLIDSEI